MHLSLGLGRGCVGIYHMIFILLGWYISWPLREANVGLLLTAAVPWLLGKYLGPGLLWRGCLSMSVRHCLQLVLSLVHHAQTCFQSHWWVNFWCYVSWCYFCQCHNMDRVLRCFSFCWNLTWFWIVHWNVMCYHLKLTCFMCHLA